jgi:DNA polymerase I-like protein with 3'-5' exonuclease and polymerase domains
MLMSLVRLHGILPLSEVRIVGTVHDSILFEVREDQVHKWVPVIHETMVDLVPLKKKFAVEMPVPIEVEVKVGQHWGDGEKWDPTGV